MTADPITALQVLLKADADVTTEVGTRVYTRALPRDESAGMPQKTVLLLPAGGASAGPSAQSYLPIETQRIDVLCFGQTEFEAMQVYRTVHAVFKGLTRQLVSIGAVSVLLCSATTEDGPSPEQADPGDWDYVSGTYLIDYAEQEVA